MHAGGAPVDIINNALVLWSVLKGLEATTRFELVVGALQCGYRDKTMAFTSKKQMFCTIYYNEQNKCNLL
jgi:hypothetical protein